MSGPFESLMEVSDASESVTYTPPRRSSVVAPVQLQPRVLIHYGYCLVALWMFVITLTAVTLTVQCATYTPII
jgi:hypothetical protein